MLSNTEDFPELYNQIPTKPPHKKKKWSIPFFNKNSLLLKEEVEGKKKNIIHKT